MRTHSTAIEYNQPYCLPPEAYIRITQACANEKEPKFKSSYYPPKPASSPTKQKSKKHS
jgi:hypothetical protein